MYKRQEEYGQDENGEAVVEVAAGGRYMTPPHLATIVQTQDDLKMHMEAHKLCAPVAAPTPAPTSAPNRPDSKPAKLERPKIEMDMTEPEWGLFVAEWERYCRSCRITDTQEKVDQL